VLGIYAYGGWRAVAVCLARLVRMVPAAASAALGRLRPPDTNAYAAFILMRVDTHVIKHRRCLSGCGVRFKA
jgi:hypothetical protein